MNCLYYYELNFLKNMVVLMVSHQIWYSPIITRETFAKIKHFVDVSWKFELHLLSRAEIFAKTREFCWSDSKIWTAPIITGWNFLKNKGVLISPENLNCSYYHELKFLQKYLIFNEVIWIFELPQLSWGIILSNMRQF